MSPVRQVQRQVWESEQEQEPARVPEPEFLPVRLF